MTNNINHTQQDITCPHCHGSFKLTETLAAPLIESIRKENEQKIHKIEQDYAKREEELKEKQDALAKAQKSIDDEVAEKLKKERASLVAEEAKKAKAALALDLQLKSQEIDELKKVNEDRENKLKEAQKAQAEFARKERELQDKERELELTIQNRINQEQAAIKVKAKQEAIEEEKLKLQEKEQTIASMQKKIEELMRKAEQGSQQLQGEVLELELENLLRTTFPFDSVLPVPKGVFGGDVVHHVNTQYGQACGQILWEFKRTKNWSAGWLGKLREDQRTAKAEIAVLVSEALPEGVDTFGQVDGVWITSPRHAVPVAHMLRHILVEVTTARKTSEGQQTKAELVYTYLTGPQFKQRVQAVVERYNQMQNDLRKERTFMQKQWAQRDMQLNLMIQSTVGMWGDIKGIAGQAVQEIEGLEGDTKDLIGSIENQPGTFEETN